MPLFSAAYAASNKGTSFILILIRPPKTCVSPLANGKIQGLFKAFECFSSTFQGIFYFQGLFKTVTVYSSTFQACVNPDNFKVIALCC